MENIKNATFTSVWDDGIEVTTNCKINMDTKEVFDVEVAYINDLDILEREYVTIDGVDHPVSCNGDTEFWYDYLEE